MTSSARLRLFREDDHMVAVTGVLAAGRNATWQRIEAPACVYEARAALLGEVNQAQALHALKRQTHGQRALHFDTA